MNASQPVSQSTREGKCVRLRVCACLCLCVSVCACACYRERNRETAAVSVGIREVRQSLCKNTIHPSLLVCLSLDYNTKSDSPFGLCYTSSCLCRQHLCVLCVWNQDNGAELTQPMTSVDVDLAGGKRGTSDHGLPSLVNRVSTQTAPDQPENGDDERKLDRMGMEQGKNSCREM